MKRLVASGCVKGASLSGEAQVLRIVFREVDTIAFRGCTICDGGRFGGLRIVGNDRQQSERNDESVEDMCGVERGRKLDAGEVGDDRGGEAD